MRLGELRQRAHVALRRRVPGGRWLQRQAKREGLRDLRRLEPVSDAFGFDRGTPIDRWYIDRFLHQHAGLINGRVLEVGDRRYADAYGSPQARVDVLAREPGRGVTVNGDLETGEGIPRDTYDCLVITQVLGVVHDVRRALEALHDALVPGGAALVTLSGISPVSEFDDARSGDHWRFTETSVRRLFSEVFGPATFEVEAHGNVLAAAAFLYGLAAEELAEHELTTRDRRFPVLIAVCARRA